MDDIYISKQQAAKAFQEYHDADVELFGVEIPECFDAQLAIEIMNEVPAADVRPVVLCRDCIYYVKSEEINGEKMCVRDADWSVEDGCYYGFTEYPQPDWFCADGVKREES